MGVLGKMLFWGGVAVAGGGLVYALTREEEAGAAMVPGEQRASVLAVHPPQEQNRCGSRVLVIGDSITATGYYKHIGLVGVEVKGQGWGGQQAVKVARNASSLLASFKPTDVVVLVGVNNVASEVVSALKKGNADPVALAAHVQRDLTTAWKLIHDAGARVWAVKMTPWFGYAKYFGAGKATAAPMRAVTLAVNGWIDAQRGQPGGPDEVIDTVSLGDASGALQKQYSRDDLHPSAGGQKALATIVEGALRGMR